MSTGNVDPLDPELVRHGRQYLIGAVGFLVVTGMAVTALYVWRIGPDQLPQQSGRLLLTMAIGYFLLRGRAWARWLLVALLVMALFAVVPFVLRPGAFARDELRSTLPLLFMYLGYGIVARGLMYSTSVRAFFQAHRAPPQVAPSDDASAGVA